MLYKQITAREEGVSPTLFPKLTLSMLFMEYYECILIFENKYLNIPYYTNKIVPEGRGSLLPFFKNYL